MKVAPDETPLELIPADISDLRLVDIREPEERVQSPFPLAGADWMPLSDWTGSQMDDRPTLFVCHAGVRSLRLTTFLRGQGYQKVFSLPGGVGRLKMIIEQ